MQTQAQDLGPFTTIRPSNDNVETMTNVTGEYSPIMKIEVPAKQIYRLYDNPQKRTALLAKLKDTNGDELPADTDIVLGVKTPGKHIAKEKAFLPYNVFRELPIKEQSQKDNQGSLLISLDEAGLEFYPNYEIQILIKSDTQVDWEQGTIVSFQVEEKSA